MKKFIFVAMAALFVSCSDHQLMDSDVDVKDAYQVEKTVDKAKVDALIEKARWGDGGNFFSALRIGWCLRVPMSLSKRALHRYLLDEILGREGRI